MLFPKCGCSLIRGLSLQLTIRCQASIDRRHDRQEEAASHYRLGHWLTISQHPPKEKQGSSMGVQDKNIDPE